MGDECAGLGEVEDRLERELWQPGCQVHGGDHPAPAVAKRRVGIQHHAVAEQGQLLFVGGGAQREGDGGPGPCQISNGDEHRHGIAR